MLQLVVALNEEEAEQCQQTPASNTPRAQFPL